MTSRVRISLLALPLAALLLSLSAAADVYRWVDANGRVHYSDRPRAGAERIKVDSRPTDTEAVEQREQQTYAERAKAEAAQQTQQGEDAVAKNVAQDVTKTREEQCKKAQADYKIAIESQRLYRTGKDGERVYLTDAEINETRVNARKAVDQLCNKQ
jgi:hypothetical protein